MFGSGMSDEKYKSLSRPWKIAYWVIIAVVFSTIAYFWITRLWFQCCDLYKRKNPHPHPAPRHDFDLCASTWQEPCGGQPFQEIAFRCWAQ